MTIATICYIMFYLTKSSLPALLLAYLSLANSTNNTCPCLSCTTIQNGRFGFQVMKPTTIINRTAPIEFSLIINPSAESFWVCVRGLVVLSSAWDCLVIYYVLNSYEILISKKTRGKSASGNRDLCIRQGACMGLLPLWRGIE